ncbi:capsid cement protein [Microbulbifer sp. EKSA008]|uniref:capsid cement protein n=1 Tax=Microbulbifer sp. EKSA008 TaxID=3243367 RepID=UPI0040418214
MQDGRILGYINNSSAKITSGQVVVGVIAIDGVFTVSKVSAAEINQGETLSWVVVSSSFDNSAATGDIIGAAAFAADDAGSSVTSFAVKFTGVPGSVKS